MRGKDGFDLNFIDEFFSCPRCNHGKHINFYCDSEHVIIECERCETTVKEYIEDQT